LDNSKPIIIIGGGIAGAHAAESLRNEGYLGRIILFDKSIDMPYDRPPLSKDYILGQKTETDLLLFDSSIYEKLNIELELGVEIKSINVEDRELTTKDGKCYQWEKLLLATGSKLRKLQVEGDHLQNIFYLKTLSDARLIKEQLSKVDKLVVIGAGFIGAELASACSSLGIDITIIEWADLPMARILGEEMGRYFLNLHRGNNVEFITNDSVASFRGASKVEGIVTTGGRNIQCQAVVIGVGVDANTILSHEKLKVDRGYIVDEFGETSIPGIFAVGDCAMWPYKEKHIHVEHWDHAVNHAKEVAKNMLQQQSSPYNRIPYFWSDQYKHRFQYLGHTTEWASTVLRGNIEDEKFTYFYLDEKNVVQAAMIVNEPKNVLPIRRLIAEKQQVSSEDLSDREISIRSIINV